MITPRKLWGGLGNQLFRHAYIYSQARKGLIPDVYVQDFEYFKDVKEEIRKMYQEGIGERKDRIAIHVRRTDYVNNSFYVDLIKTDYYQKAMAEFQGEKFMIFSDDIEWCKKQEIFNGIEFSEGKSEVEDMNEMASCKGFIGANSSFSIWSAFLNINEDKKIIMPKQYYVDGIERTKYPTDEGWVII